MATTILTDSVGRMTEVATSELEVGEMATETRDLSGDFRMPADGFAATFAVNGKYAVAWGLGYEAIAGGLGWDPAKNTVEHGVEWFATEEEADRYVATVTECHAQIEDPA
jgi:hypothetical protein